MRLLGAPLVARGPPRSHLVHFCLKLVLLTVHVNECAHNSLPLKVSEKDAGLVVMLTPSISLFLILEGTHSQLCLTSF